MRTLAVDKLSLAPSDAIGNLAIAFDGKVDTVPVNLKGITGTLANFTQGPDADQRDRPDRRRRSCGQGRGRGSRIVEGHRTSS